MDVSCSSRSAHRVAGTYSDRMVLTRTDGMEELISECYKENRACTSTSSMQFSLDSRNVARASLPADVYKTNALQTVNNFLELWRKLHSKHQI
jgi:hypothetical protein